jgi:hypothetical protein
MPARRLGLLLRLVMIEHIERKQNLADLAPEHRFVAAQPVEREVGQVGKTPEATRQLGAEVCGRRSPTLNFKNGLPRGIVRLRN